MRSSDAWWRETLTHGRGHVDLLTHNGEQKDRLGISRAFLSGISRAFLRDGLDENIAVPRERAKRLVSDFPRFGGGQIAVVSEKPRRRADQI